MNVKIEVLIKNTSRNAGPEAEAIRCSSMMTSGIAEQQTFAEISQCVLLRKQVIQIHQDKHHHSDT